MSQLRIPTEKPSQPLRPKRLRVRKAHIRNLTISKCLNTPTPLQARIAFFVVNPKICRSDPQLGVFKTIKEAITAAIASGVTENNPKTLWLVPGRYSENLTINVSGLHIRGAVASDYDFYPLGSASPDFLFERSEVIVNGTWTIEGLHTRIEFNHLELRGAPVIKFGSTFTEGTVQSKHTLFHSLRGDAPVIDATEGKNNNFWSLNSAFKNFDLVGDDTIWNNGVGTNNNLILLYCDVSGFQPGTDSKSFIHQGGRNFIIRFCSLNAEAMDIRDCPLVYIQNNIFRRQTTSANRGGEIKIVNSSTQFQGNTLNRDRVVIDGGDASVTNNTIQGGPFTALTVRGGARVNADNNTFESMVPANQHVLIDGVGSRLRTARLNACHGDAPNGVVAINGGIYDPSLPAV